MTAARSRIFVVDDEAAHMQALCDTLGAEGYEVHGFSAPREALAAVQPGRCDLLLTDLMMPGLDGISLLREARAVDTDIAGVVMTGHGTIDSAVAAMQTGALDYVLKPFRLNIILPVIARALDIRRLRIEHQALQRREQAQAAELAAAYQDLESFSYSVSHDLRAPLRAIRGFTELFLAESGAGLTGAGRQRLGQVLAGAGRMESMIGGLLEFSRYSRREPQRRHVDMQQITQRIVTELRSAEPQRPLEVIMGTLPPCIGDPGLLEQVLANLLSNAFKFTRGRADARIEIGAIGANAVEQIYFVRDNGAGFDMKYADKLFGVFQRLHTQDQFPGTGVGLSIVQRIVRRHGGRIWAESAPQRGATFYFSLPGGGPQSGRTVPVVPA